MMNSYRYIQLGLYNPIHMMLLPPADYLNFDLVDFQETQSPGFAYCLHLVIHPQFAVNIARISFDFVQ